MSKDVFVFVEHKEGSARKASLELLSKGKEIAEITSSELVGVVLGRNVDGIAEEVRAYADKVICVDQEDLQDYRWDTYVAVLARLVGKYDPALLFGASTVTGKDLFPRLAARLGAGIVSDALGIEVGDGSVRVKKPLFGGKIIAWAGPVKEGLFIVTFRPNSFNVKQSGTVGEVIPEQVETVKDSRIRLLSVEKAGSGQVDLQEADFIICGGRGTKGPENFAILEEIALIMGGRVGASRAVVDAKWRGYEDQIGKSGRSVSPKIYVGCGVSGAVHHTMGMDTSKVIVAVNKDPNAPIFNYADYGIVDDMFEVLPVFRDELRKLKESR